VNYFSDRNMGSTIGKCCGKSKKSKKDSVNSTKSNNSSKVPPNTRTNSSSVVSSHLQSSKMNSASLFQHSQSPQLPSSSIATAVTVLHGTEDNFSDFVDLWSIPIHRMAFSMFSSHLGRDGRYGQPEDYSPRVVVEEVHDSSYNSRKNSYASPRIDVPDDIPSSSNSVDQEEGEGPFIFEFKSGTWKKDEHTKRSIQNDNIAETEEANPVYCSKVPYTVQFPD